MPLPRVRLTIRRLMVAVAVVAVLIAGGDLVRKAIIYNRLARAYAMPKYVSPPAEWPATRREALTRFNTAWEAYDVAMSRKYEYAACHPWLPVAPDPPEPE